MSVRLAFVVTIGVQVRLKYSDSRKYYYSISQIDVEGELPSWLINVVSKGKNVEFQTLELRQLTQRVQDAANEISQLGDGVVVRLQGYLLTQVAEMYRVSEAIATLDMLAAFAHIAINRGYTRPTFSTTLCLRSARHPIIDQVSWDDLQEASGVAAERIEDLTKPLHTKRLLRLRRLALSVHHGLQHEWQEHIHQKHCTLANHGTDWIFCASAVCGISSDPSDIRPYIFG